MYIFCRMALVFSMFFSLSSLQAQVKKKVAGKTTAAPVKRTVKAGAKPRPTAVIPPVKASGTLVKITTDMGDMMVRLSDKTPRHRDNFIKLVNAHFYDSLIFHRIIAGFMIQGGDPESRHALPGTLLGKGDVGYTIPAEFDSTLYHKKGALAAARNNNPEKASSGCQFYIVQGRKYQEEELNMIALQKGTYFSPARRMTYKMLGGTPNLDTDYTVFGEIITGLDVLDQIANAERDNFNRPLKDIHMKMEVLLK